MCVYTVEKDQEKETGYVHDNFIPSFLKKLLKKKIVIEGCNLQGKC